MAAIAPRPSSGSTAGAPRPQLAVVPPPASGAPPKRRLVSVRWIAAALAAVLSAMGALSVGFVSERNARNVLVEEMEQRLLLQGRNLAAGSAGALLTNLPELTIQPLIKAMLTRQPELEFAVVLDAAGKVVGHPQSRWLGQPFEAPDGLVPAQTTFPLAPGETLTQNLRLLVARAPVLTPDHREIGSALVVIDRSYVEKRLDAARREQLLVVLLGLVVSVVLSFMLMSRLLQPVSVLRHGLERIGQGDLDTPIRLRDRTELGVLAHTVNDMARDLKHAQSVMIAQGRLEHEVDIARQIQRSLLPAETRRFGDLVVCGDQRSATEVGGDYYDILTLPNGRVAITIADVSGKGLPGCLVMAMLSASLNALRDAEDSPSRLLTRLDAQFAESLRPGMFVTMFYGILDPATNRMVWASAGHNPMLIYRAADGRVEQSESRGIPLGALRGGLIRKTLVDQTLELRPGDVMVHFTDGYTEALRGNTREQFGLDRLTAAVAKNGAAGVHQVIEAAIEALRIWKRDGAATDDETLLVVGREHCASTTMEADPAALLAALADARSRGVHIELSAKEKTGPAITKWIRGLAGLEHLTGETHALVSAAMLEVCDNIAEHGYAHDPTKTFDLWWVPPRDATADASQASHEGADHRLRAGRFVVRDDAPPHRPHDWQPTDFNDPHARTRGRGYGLDIIHRVMKRVEYVAETSHGNITVLAFGPTRGDELERNAR